MSERLGQARAEAEREALEAGTPYLNKAAARAWFGDGVERGVVWADANPQPHTIALSEVLRVTDSAVPSDPCQIVEVLEALGIEVES